MDMTIKLFDDLVHPEDTLARLFFLEGYNLTTTEAAAILDVSERYLVDLLKDNFDYVMAPRGATQCFSMIVPEAYRESFTRYKEFILDKYSWNTEFNFNEHWGTLRKKRMFINRDSFRAYLARDLKTEEGDIIPELLDEVMAGNTLVSAKSLQELCQHKFMKQTYRMIDSEGLRRVYLVTNSTEKPVVRFIAD